MRKFLFIAACLIAVTTHAQTATRYYIMPQAALLNGDQSVSGQIQLVAGIQKNKWLIGLGAAVDYYKVRTIPLFADIRYAPGKSRKLFCYANLGASLPWALESQHTNHFVTGVSSPDKFSTGLYSDLGIGYDLGSKPGGVMISIGYSVKMVTDTYYESVYRDFPPYTVETREFRSDYTLNRIALKIGVRL